MPEALFDLGLLLLPLKLLDTFHLAFVRRGEWVLPPALKYCNILKIAAFCFSHNGKKILYSHIFSCFHHCLVVSSSPVCLTAV